jgi:hypothetical protein
MSTLTAAAEVVADILGGVPICGYQYADGAECTLEYRLHGHLGQHPWQGSTCTDLVLFEGNPRRYQAEQTAPLFLSPRRTPHYKAPEIVFAYVDVTTDEHEACSHVYDRPMRFGDATCLYCGVYAWSPYWVAEGLYGSDYDTATWIAREWARQTPTRSL